MPTGKPLAKEDAETLYLVAEDFKLRGLRRMLGLSAGTIRRALEGGSISPSSRDAILDWLPKAQRFTGAGRG